MGWQKREKEREREIWFLNREAKLQVERRKEKKNKENEEARMGEKTGKVRKKGLRALFSNVAGTKSMQKGDWDFIQKHELEGLVEPCEKEGKGYAEKDLDGYWIKQRMAIKEDKKRRARIEE